MEINKKRYKFLMFLILITINLNLFSKSNNQIVRLARLVIDSAQLDNYLIELKLGINSANKLEKGVILLYAVSEKAKPNHITVLEIYADSLTYREHLQTPHFKRYKTVTKEMVKSLELIETNPVVHELGVKWERD